MDAASHRHPLETIDSSQLRLLETMERPDWLLDDDTREVGRRGVAAARAALRSARRRGEACNSDGEHGHPTAA